MKAKKKPVKPLTSSPESDFKTVKYKGKSGIIKYRKTEEIVIPDKIKGKPVKWIGIKAFFCYSSLSSIKIPDSVTEIGWAAFFGCQSLLSIIMPRNIRKINEQAFFGCEKLKTISLPPSIRVIGKSAFSHCTKLETAYIYAPEDRVIIKKKAFPEHTKIIFISEIEANG
jgi:hypothetical protein